MTKRTISDQAMPGSPFFSQGIRIGSTIYVSGMVGLDPATQKLAGESIQAQTRQAIDNCIAIVHAGGGSRDDIAMVTVLLARPSDFEGMNEAYTLAFPAEPPARAVARLGPELPGVLVSIAVIAQLDSDSGS